jgi:non-ribosomal peptide synthetase-like protein
MLELGDECFVADGSYVAEPNISRGRFTVGPVKGIYIFILVGHQAFLGNSSVTPPNTVVESFALLGVKSAPPKRNGKSFIKESETWLGNPPILIPKIENMGLENVFEDKTRFKPTKTMKFGRLIWEFWRIMIPIMVINMNNLVLFLWYFIQEFSFFQPIWFTWWVKALLLPIVTVLLIGWTAILVIIMKWVFMGKYVPVKAPLYSSFVRRSELCTGIQEQLLLPSFFPLFRGTIYISIFFRLMGAKIGKRVYWDSYLVFDLRYDVTEHDLVTIGDECTLGPVVGLQTHLFEGRIMKTGPITIGNRSTIGLGTIILYDSTIGEDVDILPLSLLMKGEDVQPNSRFGGLPIQSIPYNPLIVSKLEEISRIRRNSASTIENTMESLRNETDSLLTE